MKSKTINIKNGAAMRAFGARVALQILKQKSLPTMRPHSTAVVVALVGDLGAGKTTFAQGFLKALGVKRRVISPTFLIIRPYALYNQRYATAYHLDCYRLNNLTELLSLGLKEILNNPKHIVLIEWPELIKKELPKDTKWITIVHPEKGTHRIVYSSFIKGGGTLA